jgi:type 2 lantibiotic biosynthesis protein LanM
VLTAAPSARAAERSVPVRKRVTVAKLTSGQFDTSLGCLISPEVDEMATQLTLLSDLSARERDAITDATRQSLYSVLHIKLSRLLVLELNAARVTGRLSGEDSKQRWEQFIELSSRQSFWDDLAVHYPPLRARISTIVRNRCSAARSFAQRWAKDRRGLDLLCGGDPGELQEITFGAGDSHCAGSTVAVLSCESGRVVYKPRTLGIDIALGHFVAELAEDYGRPLSVRIPEVVDGGDYGWVKFVTHRYAAGHEELVSFYRGIGECLALMRLLGGSDLHAENVIAEGGTPVIIDCETLFTPRVPRSPSGYGSAFDRAMGLLGRTVLSVGLLPGRGVGLGWHGVDASAVGMLPGEQPMQVQQDIFGVGSDEAHIGPISVEAPASQNHPSPRPALAEYWPEVLRGFDELGATLRSLDARGTLRSRLQAFEECRIRVVPRATEVYGEIARMLWHPVSLHNEGPARQRAFELLRKMAANISVAPGDPAVINAEIDELLEGDIPYFWAVVREGRLHGPRGTYWLPSSNLMEDALANWRAADFALERRVIQASLVSAYINDGWRPNEVTPLSKERLGGDLEARRRRQAAHIVHGMVTNAIYGDDGSVTAIAPVFTVTGWSVQTLQQDLYNGLSGLALLAAGYLRESAAGRADPVPRLDEFLAAALHTLDLAEAKRERILGEGLKLRPPALGGYLGVTSQIWTYLVLADWKLDGGDGVERACKLAEEIPAAIDAKPGHDILSGVAGAIVPLLLLARKTEDDRYLHLASQLANRLHKSAEHRNGQAYWTHSSYPEGIGGFAHGVTGIGWALTHLARATGDTQHEQLAQEAFAFEDALWDEQEQNWIDLRGLEGARSATAWCHGAVGIGLGRLSLDRALTQPATRQILRRAAGVTWRRGIGWNHCACHGDLAAWELLHYAIAAEEAPKELTASSLLDTILTSLEQHGPSCGIAGDAFVPGLLPGVGGIAYQLLRAHPDAELPSILTPSGEEL